MVTAEIAVALPALVLVVGFALTMQAVVATRSACLDAARAGARAAARGDSDDDVRTTALRVLPRASDVSVRRAAGLVEVRVRARPVSVTRRLAFPGVAADASASDEAS